MVVEKNIGGYDVKFTLTNKFDGSVVGDIIVEAETLFYYAKFTDIKTEDFAKSVLTIEKEVEDYIKKNSQ